MTIEQVMNELKKLGTAQNIKIYKRHGAGDNVFGVSFASLRALQKRIKIDHELAVNLWATGNADARTLALLIAAPEAMTVKLGQSWVEEINYHLLADLLAGLIARSPIAEKMLAPWTKSKNEYIRQCGYALIASLLKDKPAFSDNDCRNFIKAIEQEIHISPNRARHAMNMALIAIGIYKQSLREAVYAAAGRIGKVQVDHGETSCKTPDAILYIQKAVRRK